MNYSQRNCQESKYDATRCCETRRETPLETVWSACHLLLQAAYHHVVSAQVVESANVPVDVKKMACHVARAQGFPHSPDGRMSGGPLISLLYPWRSGHLLPASTHTYTHYLLLLLLLLLLWERRYALKSQAGFPEENLVFRPPPFPSTHLMQIKDSPDAIHHQNANELWHDLTQTSHLCISGCGRWNVINNQGCWVHADDFVIVPSIFLFSDAEKRGRG